MRGASDKERFGIWKSGKEVSSLASAGREGASVEEEEDEEGVAAATEANVGADQCVERLLEGRDCGVVMVGGNACEDSLLRV